MANRTIGQYRLLAELDTFAENRGPLLLVALGVAFAVSVLGNSLFAGLEDSLGDSAAMLASLGLPFIGSSVLLLGCAALWRRQRKRAGLAGRTGMDLLARVSKLFPPEHQDAAARMLDQVQPPQRVLVMGAVLELSEGNLDRLAHYYEAAAADYREVLTWAGVRGDW